LSRCRTLAVGLVLSAGVAAVPVTPAQAQVLTLGDRNLKPGMAGRDVRVLQDFLTRVGVRTPVDGQYGPQTARRVRVWERRSSLRATGRMSRGYAAILRGQVNAGTRVLEGATAAPAGTRVAATPQPVPTTPAPSGGKATLLPSGQAVAPAGAPQEVVGAIAAANRIARRPYRYGGGHGSFEDTGYDCSGAVSYALHGAGLLSTPRDSTGFESFGAAGKGQWISVYANSGHAYAVIAGLRWDTGWNNSSSSGPRWSTTMRPATGYVVRHPAGL
jgi:peptidoglycan hydrolase-like protein with peptidoglycan-binding domain